MRMDPKWMVVKRFEGASFLSADKVYYPVSGGYMLGIIFDCDGTLIDSERAHLASWQASIKKRYGELSEEEYYSLAGQSGTAISEKLHQKVQRDSADAILQDKQKVFENYQEQGIPSIDRTVRFVRQLAEHKHRYGYKMGVASAAFKDEILRNLKSLGLLDVFEVIVSGKDDLDEYEDPEGVNKPKPYIYLHAAKLLGLDPSRCVAFEDSGPGVLSAVSAGLITYAVPNAYTKYQDFSPATFIINPETELDMETFFEQIHEAMAKR
jgi:beta-phosphoglucomutase-like phosphatase (HAD superfamily)